MSTILLGGKICTPEKVLDPGILVINNKSIDLIQNTSEYIVPKTANVLDTSGCWILPGFIDIHMHGLLGYECMGPNLDQVIKNLPKYGVTSFMATTMTRPKKETNSLISHMASILSDPPVGARCLGVHIEGPHLSPERAGVANPKWFSPLTTNEVDWLQNITNGLVRMLTFAPEEGNALDVIPYLIDNNIVPVIGHSNASYELTKEAIALGLSQATHTFNAMSPLHHRDPGVTGAVLACHSIVAQLICDGHHVHPGAMQVLLNAKGISKVCLISDAAPFAELPSGKYHWAGQDIYIDGKTTRLSDGTLAGSHALIDTGFRNLINLLNLNILEASQCTSMVPAQSVGLGTSKGQLLPGYDADIVVLDEHYRPLLTIVEGKIVYQALE
ncbi:MAG: N-acetylglucosamine-6-phosphate deacetylase [Anaerolineaceae bacterium]|nr:N-acetylglucosamine-6-phosphate deacetylase [Anaerolineaceae bacterium]MBS60793.1 N-acetylglucosamine-6-phosphate deacetylase [Anaerolineaceae bacterium]